MNQAMIEKFYEKAENLGFDRESACATLGVKDANRFQGTIGNALNALARAKKQRDNGAKTATAVALAPDEQRALYQSDELAQFGSVIRAIAPWANDPKYPVNDQEIALVVSRCDGMGLDALNSHEVHIWKDKHGKINFQIAHALLTQWVDQIHGGHTRPRYRVLNEDEKAERGIHKNDFACECTFLMKSDISTVVEMVQSKCWTPEEARDELMVRGTGVVRAAEWGGQYFAPNARDKMFKLENRAYTDAVRRKFGTPGGADIIKMRRMRGEDEIALEDWQAAASEPESTRPDQARAAADDRQPREPITDAEFKENQELLHGNPDLEI